MGEGEEGVAAVGLAAVAVAPKPTGGAVRRKESHLEP